MLALISVVISLMAVGFSILVFVDNRRRDQRDLFLRIHQQMIGERLQRGDTLKEVELTYSAA